MDETRKLEPMRWHLIVRDLGSVKKISRIIIPNGVNRDIEARYGEVMAVGDQCFEEVQVGRLIAYGQHAGATVPIRWDKQDLTVVLDEDVLAIITGDLVDEIRKELSCG